MDLNSSGKFLVAGAGGRTGATGNHVVRQLLARKLRVRALVFRTDQRSEQLAALGAEVVVGDLHDISAVRRAIVRQVGGAPPKPVGVFVADNRAAFGG